VKKKNNEIQQFNTWGGKVQKKKKKKKGGKNQPIGIIPGVSGFKSGGEQDWDEGGGTGRTRKVRSKVNFGNST